METNKEHWFKSITFYIPRLIASVMSALSMDDKGLSLKKILAAFSTLVGYFVTDKWACKENAIAFLIIWLVYAGILVGVYSIGDISNAISKAKGNDKPNN